MTLDPLPRPRWQTAVVSVVTLVTFLVGFGLGNFWFARANSRDTTAELHRLTQSNLKTASANNRLAVHNQELLDQLGRVLARYADQNSRATNAGSQAALLRAYNEVHALYCQIIPQPQGCATSSTLPSP
jgi:uncharacterized protein HemX